MKYILSLSLIACLLCSSMIQKNTSTKSQQSNFQTDSGKIIYETYCLACHQEDGGGVPNMNPPLIKTDWVLGDSSRLIKVILKGLKDTEINGDSYSNEMPSHDFLSDYQIAEVLTYVRKSFGNQASIINPETVQKQRAKK